MSTSYIPYVPEQQRLLPCALQEWLPAGHLAYFISDTVDSLELKAFHARYAGGGSRNQPFHPAMMVKVLVYAYATGVFSSRKIAKKLHEDIAFRVLAADNFPAHRTIRDFRALHLAEFTELFTQVVRLAREMGLVKLGTVAIDGTKIKANASRHKAMSYGRMQIAEVELKAQIADLMKRATAADQAERDEPEGVAPPPPHPIDQIEEIVQEELHEPRVTVLLEQLCEHARAHERLRAVLTLGAARLKV
jgi:transposase